MRSLKKFQNMKKITIRFHSGKVLNDAVILAKTLLTLFVRVGQKTYLISREAIADSSEVAVEDESEKTADLEENP